jgi:hypothetical protein
VKTYILKDKDGNTFNQASSSGLMDAVNEARQRLTENPDLGPITVWTWTKAGTVEHQDSIKFTPATEEE